MMGILPMILIYINLTFYHSPIVFFHECYLCIQIPTSHPFLLSSITFLKPSNFNSKASSQMASFSYQQHSFLLDSVFLPNTPIKMSGFLEEPNTTTTICFPQIYPSEPLQEFPFDVSVHDSSCLEHGTDVALGNNKPSVTYIHSTDSSSVVVDKLGSGEQVTQKRKNRDGSSFSSDQPKDLREVDGKKQKKCNGVKKDVKEKKPKADKKDQKKVPEEAPTGYIHVRARRGQATDSHSLAERVRREKISERMKLLQALVPGCDKVAGKTLMLDEIISYIQSLQNQVEFLSMKLASVNPMFYDFGVDIDALMVRSERLSGLTSPLSNVQQCLPAQQPNVFSDSPTTFNTSNNHPLMDSLSSFLFQQGQRQNVLSKDNEQLFWGVDDHRQKFINQSAFNNLCSLH